jgi:hypothetical protein
MANKPSLASLFLLGEEMKNLGLRNGTMTTLMILTPTDRETKFVIIL